jgi:site-specific DNA recombinase
LAREPVVGWDYRAGGGLCYGYDIVRETDARGEPVHGGRCINEGEAAIVRRIFEAYAAGKTARVIAHELNKEGVPGPGRRAWGDTTMRGHYVRRTGILNNELYVGRLVWNRQRYVKDPWTGKRLARPNPEKAWITTELPELRIVDDELWERVRRRLAAVRASPMVTVRGRTASRSSWWEKSRK